MQLCALDLPPTQRMCESLLTVNLMLSNVLFRNVLLSEVRSTTAVTHGRFERIEGELLTSGTRWTEATMVASY